MCGVRTRRIKASGRSGPLAFCPPREETKMEAFIQPRGQRWKHLNEKTEKKIRAGFLTSSLFHYIFTTAPLAPYVPGRKSFISILEDFVGFHARPPFRSLAKTPSSDVSAKWLIISASTSLPKFISCARAKKAFLQKCLAYLLSCYCSISWKRKKTWWGSF